jgi:hypothetical protein
MVIPDSAPCQPHGEHVAYSPHALSGRSFFQIVVAVPARLLGWVGDELENAVCAGSDLAVRPYDAPRLLLVGHTLIQA